MMEDHIYKPLNTALPCILPRSRLYHLQPIGIGTAQVESLIGYFTRLANAHCYTSSILFIKEVFPVMQRLYQPIERRSDQCYFSSYIRFANGTGIIAKDIALALEHLTFQQGLHFLTMAARARVLSDIQLTRKIRTWCPNCYQQWLERGVTVYEPLIWSLVAVTYCSNHQRLLSFLCPHCNEKQPLEASYIRPGFCSKCRRWLGNNAKGRNQNLIPQEELDIQIWLTNAVGEMLAAAPSLRLQLDKHMFVESIFSCMTNTVGTSAGFAKLLNFQENVIKSWIKGISIPQLSSLLRIAYLTGIAPLDFLTGKDLMIAPGSIVDLRLRSPEQKVKKTFRRGHTIDWTKVLPELEFARYQYPPPSLINLVNYLAQKGLLFTSYSIRRNYPELCREICERHTAFKKANYLRKVRRWLEDILKNDEGPPPSMNEVCKLIAKELGLRYATFLYRRFPDLCHAISDRFLKYRREKEKQKRLKNQERIREVAISLHKMDIYPSRKKVDQILKRSFRWKEAELIALNDIRKQLTISI